MMKMKAIQNLMGLVFLFLAKLLTSAEHHHGGCLLIEGKDSPSVEQPHYPTVGC